MARAVERIEQDIAALEEASSAIAAELRSAYGSYLTTLGQAVRQQLILASYHLCTQGYPDAFVSLSFTQRQQLQQAIRKLGQHGADQLLAHTKMEDGNPGRWEPKEMETEEEDDADLTPSPPHPLTPSPSHLSNPGFLAQWQQNLELAIAQTLKTLSRDTNRLLQQAGILPKKLPEPLLEAAAKSEASAESTAGPPNLLNLLIENENEESEDSTVTQIIAIHLRLSEIEFADATVRTGRNKIRNLLLRASSLGREYHKKQQEWAIAQAEGAWRASWFEE